MLACDLFYRHSSNIIFGIHLSTGFAIEGPSQARIECDDQNDGSCNVCYWPTEPGEYAVHVMCDDEDIADSPFMAFIVPENKSNNPSQVKDVSDQEHVLYFTVQSYCSS